jgi:membrane-associated phospholipid phosphatase
MVKLFLKKYDFLKPIDLLVFVYFFVLSLIVLIFHKGLENYWNYIGLHVLFLTFMFLFIKYTHDSRNKFFKFFRNFYPIIFSPFIYKELDNFMLIISPYWLDGYIINFEYWICGFHPTVMLQKIVSPLLTEVLKFSYFSYYFIVFVPALYFYFSKRHKIFNEHIETLMIAFYISYIGFILFPVRGPRYELAYLHTIQLDGYFFTRLQDIIMKSGSTYGGCMPSSHVAVACVSWRVINIHFKKISYFLLPLVILLCFSTVYHRYHYFSDVFAGLIVSCLALSLRPMLNEFYMKKKFL